MNKSEINNQYLESLYGKEVNGKVSPSPEDIKRIIQIEKQRTFHPDRPNSPEELKEITLESYKKFLKEFLNQGQVTLEEFFSEKTINQHLDNLLQDAKLHFHLTEGEYFLLLPVPFNESYNTFTKEEVEKGDHIEFILVSNFQEPIKNRIYKGTYLHHILPKEIYEAGFQIPKFEFNELKTLTSEYKEKIVNEIKLTLLKIKDLLDLS